MVDWLFVSVGDQVSLRGADCLNGQLTSTWRSRRKQADGSRITQGGHPRKSPSSCKQAGNIRSSPVFCPHGVLTVHFVCPALLGSGWLKWRELSPPLLADVIIPSPDLPGELGDRCSLVFSGPVQLTDVVAVFGWVILHGSTSVAFLTSELQDGEDSSEFTDHPVLKPEHPEDSQYLHLYTTGWVTPL